MKIEEVILKIKEKQFEPYNKVKTLADKLEEHNIQSWSDGTRILMIKEYKTENAFIDWSKIDHPIIGEFHTIMEPIYKNNIYFLLVLNFDISNSKTRLEINKAEKNEYICKKQVITSISELDKLPFLNNKSEKVNEFNFDEKFKKSMVTLSVSEDYYQIEINKNQKEELLNNFFNAYLEHNSFIEKEILEILEIGEKNEYK